MDPSALDPRRRLSVLLDAYRREQPEERATIERFRRLVASEPRCFERTLASGHLTGAAWLVSGDGERVLLTHHRKLGAWLQLGGHADGDRDLLAVALREAREESGIEAIVPVSEAIFDLDVHEIAARRAAGGVEPAHLHYDVRFALRVHGDEAYRVSSESHALAWVHLDRLEDYTTEASILRMRSKWRLLERRS